MGKKRIHRKPVALTFADTSNQPTEQDGEGCSSWNPGQRERNQRDGKESSAQQRHKNGDEDEIECMGMVSSSTATTDNHRNSRPSNRELVRRQQEEKEQRIKKQEEEEFQRALELSRQETQVTSVTNSTSDGIISNDEIEGGDRVQTNNGVGGGGEIDGDSSGLEDVGLGIHGEAQAQTSGRCDASHENARLDGAGSSDGEDSDVTDISNEENERGVAAEASGHVEDDVEDEEGNGDDDDSSVGSSILLQSDEEVDKISSQEITAGQPPHASSSCPTQSSEKAVAKVGPLEDRNAETPDGSIDIFDVTEDQEELSQELYVDNQRPGDQEGSIDIFDVMEDQDELAQELYVDSQRSHQGHEPQAESTHSQEEDKAGSSNMDSKRTRLSLRKRKRNGEEGSEPRTNSNKTKAPRLAQEPESEGSEVDVEVGAGDEDEDSSAPPSQDAGFIDFPQRFSDNAGVPLVDPRKPIHKSPFLAPDGVLPNAYTAVILRLFYQYKMRLLKTQAKQKHRLALGKPVVIGPHVKDTIVHKKRGQKVFQWLLSSDEESTGNSQENDPEVANQARLVKPLRTELGHLSKVFQNNTNVNKVRMVPGNQQAEARPAGFKPKLEWTRSVSGSSGVQNNARTTGFLSLRTADEVSSSRTLVSKVSPVQKRAVGEWTSKSEMTRKREAKRRSSSSDESDADVEVVPVNTTTRNPLTATVSPRRSTPAESQSSSSLRSPVFGGKSSRGLVRPSSGVPRQVGHCSPRTLQNNRDKMESPQPSSPRLRVDNDARTHVTIVAESASGVSSTVPDNGGRHAMSRVDQHQEATASGTVSSGMPTSRTGVVPRYGCHKPRSCNPPEPQDLSYQKKRQKKKHSHGNRYSLTEALSLTKDYLSQSTWDDEMDDHECLVLDVPIAASQAACTNDVFMGMVPGNIEGLYYHTGKVSDHEMVSLVREPLNRYLKNAMKVENAWGDQVGHIKSELAEVLAYILDNNYARIEGVVPSGNKNIHVYSMPVDISLYGPRCNQMTVLQILKGRGHTVSMVESKKSSTYNPRSALGKSVMLSEIEMKNEVDTLFDNLKLTEQEPSKCIVSTMYPHQKQALHWMLARESNDKPATPSGLYHKSLTNFTSAKRPDSVRGGILADDMGLGKTLSIIALVLHEFAKPEFVDLAPSLPNLPEKDEVDCNEPSTSQVKQEVNDEAVMIKDSQEFPIVSEEVIVIEDDSESSDNNTTIVIKDGSPTTPCSSNSTTVTANGRHKRSKDIELTQAVTAGKRRLDNLEGSRKKRLKLYGDYMPNLLAEIDRYTANNQFHQKPLGPVGSFLKLKDVRWALGVESCLKRLMYSFRCHDQHDASVLKDIMNRLIPQHATQPSIITSQFEANRYDIRHSSVQSNDFPSFLDIVDISNPVIFNTLVNQRGVESILLIEKSKDARNYLRQPPKNCREAFSLEGDQVYAGAEQRFYTSMQKSAKIFWGDTDIEIRASAANVKFTFSDDSDDNPSPEKKAKMKPPKMATAPKVEGPSQPVASLPGPNPPINSMVPFNLSSHWFSKPMKAEVSKPMKAEVSKPMKVKGHRGHGDAVKPRTTLIVCPLSVMSNWIDQLHEHVADELQVNVCMYHGAEKKKLKSDYLKQQDVVITTYGTLAADFKAKQEKGTLQKIEWLRIVLDEAHIIRNRRTLQAQAAIALKAQCKWALTGTPIQNSIKDLWTLVAFLGMEHEPFNPNLNSWQRRKARSIADNDSAGIDRLRKLMNTLALRRMKSQKVNGKPLVDLPARNVVLQYVDFSEDEKKVYQTYEKEGRLAVSKYFREGTVLDHYGEILVIILRLRQLCCHPALCAKAAAKLCQAIDGNERTDEEKAQLVAILVSFLSQGADEECCICLESVQDPVVTRCAHVFCQRCIEEVIISEKEHARCPLCRQAVSRESLVHVPKDRSDTEKGNTEREWHSSAKVDALMECLLTERAADKTTKSIVVSQFTSFLDLLVKPLTEKGFKFSRLDGSMLRDARTAAISEFSSNDPDSPQIFLLSLKAGGVGLNLTAASRLYLLDPAWNPACEEQSFDRCHRLGQTKDVTITKFLVRESIEEAMLKIQEFKRQLMKQVFGGKNQTPEERRMNRLRDVRILFGMDKTNSR